MVTIRGRRRGGGARRGHCGVTAGSVRVKVPARSPPRLPTRCCAHAAGVTTRRAGAGWGARPGAALALPRGEPRAGGEWLHAGIPVGRPAPDLYRALADL